jgi:DNA polymerase I-like protein with 3'-5' exonuclease and polymerase domains
MKLDLRKATTVDFESYPIESRPSYPPKPVGVAIRWPNGKAEYLAWAHPAGGNNCKLADAKRVLAKIAAGTGPVLFHNAKFDLCVWSEGLGVKLPAWDRIHDTLPMLFIRDPRAATYSLKPTAELLLKEPPEERDAVIDWLVQHQPVPGVKLTAKAPKNRYTKGAKDTTKKTQYAGAYVAYAPVSLVGPYAIGDVTRTYDLAQLVGAEVAARGMVPAYRREVDLIEPIMDMERRGVPVDVEALAKDVVVYSNAVASVDLWLRKRLKVPAGVEVNWDSNKDLVKYMLAAGVVTEGSLGLTPSGEVQTNKDALARGVTDPQVLAVLKYRSRVVSSLDTFMRPWLATAQKWIPLAKGDGMERCNRIFTTWYTTRHDEHGARTGRMASSPNLQNMTKKKVTLFEGEAPAWWKKLGLPELPFVRRYIIAERGHVLIDRDKSQQELRILAHYTDGELLQKYLEDPWFDVHALIKTRVDALVCREVPRDPVKRLVFSTVYGMGKEGAARLAPEYHMTVVELIQIGDAVKKAVPGLADLQKRLKEHTRKGLPIITWGGREYYVEPPRLKKDKKGEVRMHTFEYKLPNDLIQASAADDLKECILWFWRHAPRKYKLILTVHDELVVSAPAGEMHKAMAMLKKAMNHVKFDVPMLSEGKYGPNMASLVDYDKKGVDVYAGKSA